VTQHRIEVRPAVRQALLALPKPTRRRLQHTIDSLAEQPHPQGVRQLAGPQHALKLNAGSHEVLYAVEADVITILDVAHRISPWLPTTRHEGGP
jgi:mRNA interferase RelE/StbE